jgi:hypothetical protein
VQVEREASSFLSKRVGARHGKKVASFLQIAFRQDVLQKSVVSEMCQIVGVNSLSAEARKPWQNAALMGATS